jgi:phospholipid-translocating ATPase/phospholipid-transporting ATPase
MKQIIISSDTPENKALEKMEDKAAGVTVISDFICCSLSVTL